MNEQTLAGILIGESLLMQRVRSDIIRLAPARLPVFVHGPTGSGKELVARALHLASGRPGAFIGINACALGDTLFEDALFGHRRGGFTGADSDSAGFLAEADRGTILLDEITGVPYGLQAKLLRAIELKEFRPIGAKRDQRSDFRVVSASNEDLTVLVQDGRFRRDLAERLCGVTIQLPGLIDRSEDIPLISAAILRELTEDAVVLSDGALLALQEHRWPGNVRELRHVIERAFVFAEGDRVERGDVIHAIERGHVSNSCAVSTPETRCLLEALELAEHRVDVAAALLGVNRATVYRRMRRLGVMPESIRGRRKIARAALVVGDVQPKAHTGGSAVP